MARIENLDNVFAALNKMRSKILGDQKGVSVIVGYSAGYAMTVHENMEARHGSAWNAAYITTTDGIVKSGKNKGQVKPFHQWTSEAVRRGYDINKAGNTKKPVPKNPNQTAKFLEQPARMFSRQIVDIVRSAVVGGKTMAQALLLGGLFLQRKSQEIVPVDTGSLRASAFTRLE